MKKSCPSLLFALSFTFILLFSLVSSLDTDVLTDPINNAQEQFNDIPKTPEEIKAEYLKQEWNKIILNQPIIGPIHKFFQENSLPFKVLFNENYSFSLTFIVTLILWFITLKIVYSPSKEAFDKNVALALGIGVPIIFAHLSIYKIIITKMLYLVFSQETFWMRTIVWFILGISIIVIIMIDEILSKKVKQNKEAKKEREIKEGIEESQTFIKTLKEYLGILKKSK